MEKENILGVTEDYIKEIGLMERCMERKSCLARVGNSFGQMARNIKVGGKMVSSIEKQLL